VETASLPKLRKKMNTNDDLSKQDVLLYEIVFNPMTFDILASPFSVIALV
jgi:hypothetical protein